MANSARLQTITFRDSKRYPAKMSLFIVNTGALTATQLQTNAGNIINDVTAMTNAAFQSSAGPSTSVPVAPVVGAQATYETAEDKLQMTFTTATGAIHRYQVPAPLAVLFLNDGETVDVGNSLVKQFCADMLNATFGGTAVSTGQTAGACSRNGEVLSAFIGGIRVRRKLQRKQSILSLSPSGGEGE